MKNCSGAEEKAVGETGNTSTVVAATTITGISGNFASAQPRVSSSIATTTASSTIVSCAAVVSTGSAGTSSTAKQFRLNLANQNFILVPTNNGQALTLASASSGGGGGSSVGSGGLGTSGSATIIPATASVGKSGGKIMILTAPQAAAAGVPHNLLGGTGFISGIGASTSSNNNNMVPIQIHHHHPHHQNPANKSGTFKLAPVIMPSSSIVQQQHHHRSPGNKTIAIRGTSGAAAAVSTSVSSLTPASKKTNIVGAGSSRSPISGSPIRSKSSYPHPHRHHASPASSSSHKSQQQPQHHHRGQQHLVNLENFADQSGVIVATMDENVDAEDVDMEIKRLLPSGGSSRIVISGNNSSSSNASSSEAIITEADAQKLLITDEKLDRESPELWPEQVPGVVNFIAATEPMFEYVEDEEEDGEAGGGGGVGLPEQGSSSIIGNQFSGGISSSSGHSQSQSQQQQSQILPKTETDSGVGSANGAGDSSGLKKYSRTFDFTDYGLTLSLPANRSGGGSCGDDQCSNASDSDPEREDSPSSINGNVESTENSSRNSPIDTFFGGGGPSGASTSSFINYDSIIPSSPSSNTTTAANKSRQSTPQHNSKLGAKSLHQLTPNVGHHHHQHHQQQQTPVKSSSAATPAIATTTATTHVPEWQRDLDEEEVAMLYGYGSLTTSALMDKVKEIQNLSYQLGLEEEREMARARFLNILGEGVEEDPWSRSGPLPSRAGHLRGGHHLSKYDFVIAESKLASTQIADHKQSQAKSSSSDQNSAAAAAASSSSASLATNSTTKNVANKRKQTSKA